MLMRQRSGHCGSKSKQMVVSEILDSFPVRFMDVDPSKDTPRDPCDDPQHMYMPAASAFPQTADAAVLACVGCRVSAVVLPILFLIAIMAYLDKSNVNFAAIR
jgi:hypothetical protein